MIRAGRSERSEFLILGAASVAIFSYWAQRACITFSSSGRSERSEFFAGRSERSEFFILGAARKTKQGAASDVSSKFPNKNLKSSVHLVKLYDTVVH